MMHFSTGEILLSLLYAALFGVGFFLLYTAASVIISQIKRISVFPLTLVKYNKILEKPIKNQSRNAIELSSALIIAFVILFSLGFVLLSYYALDGCVRIYLFLIALAAFLLPKRLLFERLIFIFDRIFDIVFYVITLLLRVAIFPLLRLFLHFNAKKSKIRLPFIKK